MKSWKSSESRAGIWLGAKGLKKSGRVPLSGSNSGVTNSDTPHPTIYCEVKRSKKYYSAIELWENYNKQNKKSINILTLPIVEDDKIISKTSSIWFFHNKDAESIYHHVCDNKTDVTMHQWKGNYPSVLTLYEETVATWKNSKLDKNKKLAHCAVFKHGKQGFWIVIDKNDIIKWWPLILEARSNRQSLINEEPE